MRNWKYFESMLSSFYSLPSNSFKPYSIFNDLILLRNDSWLLHSQPLGFTSCPSQTCPKLLVHGAGIIYKQLGWKRKKKSLPLRELGQWQIWKRRDSRPSSSFSSPHLPEVTRAEGNGTIDSRTWARIEDSAHGHVCTHTWKHEHNVFD